MTVKLTNWEPSESLDSEEMICEYLKAALEENDEALFMSALGDIAKARGMSQIAKESGLNRTNLYKAFSGEVSPQFSTVQKITKAVGLHLTVVRLTP